MNARGEAPIRVWVYTFDDERTSPWRTDDGSGPVRHQNVIRVGETIAHSPVTNSCGKQNGHGARVKA